MTALQKLPRNSLQARLAALLAVVATQPSSSLAPSMRHPPRPFRAAATEATISAVIPRPFRGDGPRPSPPLRRPRPQPHHLRPSARPLPRRRRLPRLSRGLINSGRPPLLLPPRPRPQPHAHGRLVWLHPRRQRPPWPSRGLTRSGDPDSPSTPPWPRPQRHPPQSSAQPRPRRRTMRPSSPSMSIVHASTTAVVLRSCIEVSSTAVALRSPSLLHAAISADAPYSTAIPWPHLRPWAPISPAASYTAVPPKTTVCAAAFTCRVHGGDVLHGYPAASPTATAPAHPLPLWPRP